MKTQSMSISDFMSGDFKSKKKSNLLKAATTATVPLMFTTHHAFAATTTEVQAVPAGSVSNYLSDKTLETLAHALDPLVDLMVALAFPVCSVIIVGSCFFFMLGKSERAWSGIQNAGLGYVLIQLLPMLLNVLKSIGDAI